jgi:hypothetical protein
MYQSLIFSFDIINDLYWADPPSMLTTDALNEKSGIAVKALNVIFFLNDSPLRTKLPNKLLEPFIIG